MLSDSASVLASLTVDSDEGAVGDASAVFADAGVIRAPSLVRSQVAEYLRKAIVDRRLRPGQLLVERELCDATTASRGSVREALRQLETEGLVTSAPGRGTSVATLTEQQARHIYEVRASLEGLAGGLFAVNATDGHLRDLEAVVDRIADLADDPTRLLAVKDEFYDVLLAGAGNPELRQLLDILHRRVTLTRSTSLGVPGRPPKSIAEMRAILEAAKDRDATETARRCVSHVLNAAEAALGPEAVKSIHVAFLMPPEAVRFKPV
ncbi:MAG: FCD domain-containing protein [Propionibacteriales bacterium]|nr:FCD domain-containing protein [Propionibacteriales bacterium]